MKHIQKLLLGLAAFALLAAATPAAQAYDHHNGRGYRRHSYYYHEGHYGYYYNRGFYPYYAGPRPYYYGPYDGPAGYGPGVTVAVAPRRHHFFFFF